VKNGEQEAVECRRHKRRSIDYCFYLMRLIEHVQKAHFDDGAVNPMAGQKRLAKEIK
jgi:hypothetical protein